MKRVLCIMCILTMLFSSCLAEPMSTQKRNAFEFCDLYMSRLDDAKDQYLIDATHDLYSEQYFVWENMPLVDENEYYVNVLAGDIIVSVPEFEIERMSTQLINFADESLDRSISLIRAAMAYAALEYDGFDDFSFSQLSKIDPDRAENVIEEVHHTFLPEVNKALENDVLMEQLFSANGNQVHLISRNYDYSLQYFCFSNEERDYEYIDLVAEARGDKSDAVFAESPALKAAIKGKIDEKGLFKLNSIIEKSEQFGEKVEHVAYIDFDWIKQANINTYKYHVNNTSGDIAKVIADGFADIDRVIVSWNEPNMKMDDVQFAQLTYRRTIKGKMYSASKTGWLFEQ